MACRLVEKGKVTIFLKVGIEYLSRRPPPHPRPGGGLPGLNAQNIPNLNPTSSNAQNTANMTAEEYKEEEKIIAKAVNAYQHGKIKNISRLVCEFGVS